MRKKNLSTRSFHIASEQISRPSQVHLYYDNFPRIYEAVIAVKFGPSMLWNSLSWNLGWVKSQDIPE